MPPCGTRQKQVGDVGAGDQQNESHRARENHKRWTKIDGAGIAQREYAHSRILVVIRILELFLLGDGVHFHLRLSERRARFQTRHYVHETVASVGIGRLRQHNIGGMVGRELKC